MRSHLAIKLGTSRIEDRAALEKADCAKSLLLETVADLKRDRSTIDTDEDFVEKSRREKAIEQGGVALGGGGGGLEFGKFAKTSRLIVRSYWPFYKC